MLSLRGIAPGDKPARTGDQRCPLISSQDARVDSSTTACKVPLPGVVSTVLGLMV